MGRKIGRSKRFFKGFCEQMKINGNDQSSENNPESKSERGQNEPGNTGYGKKDPVCPGNKF
jgi:hypothetical protein